MHGSVFHSSQWMVFRLMREASLFLKRWRGHQSTLPLRLLSHDWLELLLQYPEFERVYPRDKMADEELRLLRRLQDEKFGLSYRLPKEDFAYTALGNENGRVDLLLRMAEGRFYTLSLGIGDYPCLSPNMVLTKKVKPQNETSERIALCGVRARALSDLDNEWSLPCRYADADWSPETHVYDIYQDVKAWLEAHGDAPEDGTEIVLVRHGL